MLKKVFFEPFKKETGINVIATAPTRLPKLKAMVESGNVEWDVVVLLDSWVERVSRDNLLEPIDYSKIDRNDLYPDAVSKYGTGIFFFATGMAYNKEAYPKGNYPKTWAEFWDVKKFPGKRGMYKGPMEVLEFALMADGLFNAPKNASRMVVLNPDGRIWWGKNEAKTLERFQQWLLK